MIEYRTSTLVKRDHKANGDEWDEWHVSGDRIQRCLLDQEGFVLATETLEGDVAALVAFATTGSDLSAHDGDMAHLQLDEARGAALRPLCWHLLSYVK